jgi:hypothetical protein
MPKRRSGLKAGVDLRSGACRDPWNSTTEGNTMTTTTYNRFFTRPSRSLGVATLLKQAFAFLRQQVVTQASAEERSPVSNATRQASHVRRMALQYMARDPRYAADLFAAADRHEQASGQ